MEMEQDESGNGREVRARAPFWAIALFSLVWNAFGAYDYVETNIRDADYLAKFPPEMIQVIDAFPHSVTAAWAIGVWAALAGSIFLLLRSRLAVHAFGFSLLGLAVVSLYMFSIDIPEAAKVPGSDAMMLLIWIVAVLLLVLSLRWRTKGQLR